MSKKEFVESHGAICDNYRNKWSFVNDAERFVVFGIWDYLTDGDVAIVFSKDWERNDKGHRRPGYRHSRQNIRLIQEDDYKLFVFRMVRCVRMDPNGPNKMASFEPTLIPATLRPDGSNWYAEIHSSTNF